MQKKVSHDFRYDPRSWTNSVICTTTFCRPVLRIALTVPQQILRTFEESPSFTAFRLILLKKNLEQKMKFLSFKILIPPHILPSCGILLSWDGRTTRVLAMLLFTSNTLHVCYNIQQFTTSINPCIRCNRYIFETVLSNVQRIHINK